VDDKALVLIPRGDDMRHSSKTRELGRIAVVLRGP
jgi:hypothetical protein